MEFFRGLGVSLFIAALFGVVFVGTLYLLIAIR